MFHNFATACVNNRLWKILQSDNFLHFLYICEHSCIAIVFSDLLELFDFGGLKICFSMMSFSSEAPMLLKEVSTPLDTESFNIFFNFSLNSELYGSKY